MIEGNTVIGEKCTIGPNSQIVDSIIADRTTVHSSVVLASKIGTDTAVGPFAHIRPESDLGNNVRIGNFVEVKKSTLGEGSKASHLSYIGDANVGSGVNFGCGTIAVNYDGKKKHVTTIEDDAFIGCNSNLNRTGNRWKRCICGSRLYDIKKCTRRCTCNCPCAPRK